MTASSLLSQHSVPVPSDIWERTADVVGIWSAARRTHEGQILETLFDGSTDMKISGRSAIVRYSEADPINLPSCMTADCISVPVALSAASSAESYFRAITIGSAVGVRIARAAGGAGALSLGIWPSLFAAPAVAAVTDAIARGLPSAEIKNALELSMSGGSGRIGRPGGVPSGRWTTFGEAVYRGLRAVRAVQLGATSDPEIFSIGWWHAHMGDFAIPEAMNGSEGDTKFCIKSAVCARQALTAMAGLEIMLNENKKSIVNRVEVKLPTCCIGVVTRQIEPGNRLSEIANLQVAMGVVARDPERLLDIGRETAITDNVFDFAKLIFVSADPSLDKAPTGTWPAILKLICSDGVYEKRFDDVPGDTGLSTRLSVLQKKLKRFGANDALSVLMRSSTEDDDVTLALFMAAFSYRKEQNLL